MTGSCGATFPPPDVLLLAAAWQPRALIRAQLIEEGLDVVATDTWAMMRRSLRPGSKPRLAIVDLHGLESPLVVLQSLRALMAPDRVIVLTAMGTVGRHDIAGLGFRVLSRPIVIKDVIAAAAEALRAADATSSRGVTEL